MNVAQRLRGPHPSRPPPQVVTAELLDSISYDDIDMLNALPREPSHKGYAVVGGAGFMARRSRYIVRLLLLRGETSIRILDLVPPPQDLLDDPAVSYIPTDISSRTSVNEGLFVPFVSSGSPPSVIFHCAANIRFCERASYTWPASYYVNVLGTEHVVSAAQALPKGAILVYTSSADVSLPLPRFWHIGEGDEAWPYTTPVVSDADPPLPSIAESPCCYTRSKVMAEKIVREANGGGLTTGVLRPGQTITGPNDRLLTSTLTMSRVPVWDPEWSHTNICVWDAASAHLALERALQERPEKIGGEAFLVTGKGPAWTMRDIRNTVKHFSSRGLTFSELSPLLILLLAYLMEAFLFVRYHLLFPFFFVFGSRPSLTPSWLGQAVYLQPATLEYMRDVIIDDSRAREMIGYRPQWSTAQVIKYTVDQIEAGAVNGEHGLKLK
ncbi:NAD(P)-binding protein [Vararia minispora EC-137]|uniref:NAD(P)-binding protein n=1 Tax=Vararia minispora EC-137 TaxID=1314806 RepID=A0ACB8QFA7_9AGAM|nr:NAD(P)-binding protein [Vararia minispora EC-137]